MTRMGRTRLAPCPWWQQVPLAIALWVLAAFILVWVLLDSMVLHNVRNVGCSGNT